MDLFIENQTDLVIPLEHNKIEEIVAKVLEMNNKKSNDPWEISIVFVERDEIRTINRDYRNIDRATDVISFAYQEGEGSEYTPYALGDLVIAPEIVSSHAKQYSVAYEYEMIFMIVHGMLHLLGFDHVKEKDRAFMRKKEYEIMNTVTRR